MNSEAIERIREMESALDECTDAAAQLSSRLDRMDALRERMIALNRYYSSAEWYSDRESELPDGLKAGVLSEDAVYDEISDMRELALRMLELAADILKNRL